MYQYQSQDENAAPRTQADKDNSLVCQFAAAMQEKLRQKREGGVGGWDNPSIAHEALARSLIRHVMKGDPIDVANYCAFLWGRGASSAVLTNTWMAVPAHIGLGGLAGATSEQAETDSPCLAGELVEAKKEFFKELAEKQSQLESAHAALADVMKELEATKATLQATEKRLKDRDDTIVGKDETITLLRTGSREAEAKLKAEAKRADEAEAKAERWQATAMRQAGYIDRVLEEEADLRPVQAATAYGELVARGPRVEWPSLDGLNGMFHDSVFPKAR